MERKKVVIFTRHSCEMQRPDSCKDQARNVRRALPAKGVNPEGALVLKDKAESGTLADRPAMLQLLGMIERREISVLAVDDQSRFSRGDNVFQTITDLVYSGGRFIATAEGIDTNDSGWELKVKVMELHHSTTIRELGNRVRRGQEGRVLDGNGSAGDFCLGYRAEFADPNHTAWIGRSPKPKKVVVVYEPEAGVVRMVFAWFIGGMSISEIVRKLNSLNVDKGHRSSRRVWYHQIVRRMLSNAKYVGFWVWGKTHTLRNSRGRKKQVPVDAHAIVTRDRPDLRIIDDVTWEKAQALLQRLQGIYGQRAHQKRRGKRTHYTDLYPASMLGGLVYCGMCGARMITQMGGGYKYLGCPNRRNGTCTMTCRVPVDRAEQSLIGFVGGVLTQEAAWIDAAVESMRASVAAVATAVPDALAADEQQLQRTERGIAKLTEALADGMDWSPALREKFTNLETEAANLRQRIDQQRRLLDRPVELPDDAWIRHRLADLQSVMNEDERTAAVMLRKLIGKVTAHEVRPRGKKRGYAQLRFRVDAFEALYAALEGRLNIEAIMASGAGSSAAPQRSPEFVLDLGRPSRMDQLAPKIAELRKAGVAWNEIGRITGLSPGNAWTAWKRWTAAGDEDTAAA